VSSSRFTSQFGPNEWLVEEMYQRFLDDPGSVDSAWHDFFADYQPGGGKKPVGDGPVVGTGGQTRGVTRPGGAPLSRSQFENGRASVTATPRPVTVNPVTVNPVTDNGASAKPAAGRTSTVKSVPAADGEVRTPSRGAAATSCACSSQTARFAT